MLSGAGISTHLHSLVRSCEILLATDWTKADIPIRLCIGWLSNRPHGPTGFGGNISGMAIDQIANTTNVETRDCAAVQPGHRARGAHPHRMVVNQRLQTQLRQEVSRQAVHPESHHYRILHHSRKLSAWTRPVASCLAETIDSTQYPDHYPCG